MSPPCLSVLGSHALLRCRATILCTVPDRSPLLDYAECGGYCGLGGSGAPVDELDGGGLVLVQVLHCAFDDVVLYITSNLSTVQLKR